MARLRQIPDIPPLNWQRLALSVPAMHDVCIVGAGPAGLNAALVLGRCGRDVVVFDSGQPRNRVSRGLHGYLTRDGVEPLSLRELGRNELKNYPSVRVEETEVISARRSTHGFALALKDGRAVDSRFLLLATGRIDMLPDKPGFKKFYGRGVYHCPYCDGWEHRGQKLVVYGGGCGGVDLALVLLTWTRNLTFCLGQVEDIAVDHRAKLAANDIRVISETVSELRGDTELREIRFANGDVFACDALFFSAECRQKSALPEMLGCQFDDAGSVVCAAHAATGIPGLYVAGNVRGGVHLAIMAAAEGAEAAIAINDALLEQQLR